MKFILSAILVLFTLQLSAQKIEAYQLYNKKGRKVNFKRLVKSVKKKDIILFGELHDNPIAHWMQLKLAKELNHENDLVLGAEMLETDNQEALNDYLNNKINQKSLDSLARLWVNHKTDYKPLVDFAKSENLKFVATNIPRRYASQVYRNGFEVLDTLPKNEKNWIAPLPIDYDPDLPGYKKMLTMMEDHKNPNFPKAQAIKDATMAYFIMKNRAEGQQFLHFNGAYHSNNFEGIYWYLKQADKEVKIATISTVMQKDVSKLEEEYKLQADFILVVDKEMTRTY
ncbi:ChaN family lipoprotein [Haloflavibacter putidus]|uniref:ChaN family lipoprotein n=1 Tax=Haloflavibacter putidus TaxID=2576776 RepID=A0A507ZE59_9FLAO|nr:ChaN family lipoprotein [Haloflavibacter putidus]TQD35379.1 ChaN family lipoprotein [Haloflavibacter putidus]